MGSDERVRTGAARPLFTVGEAATAAGARLVSGDPATVITGVEVDSRYVRPGDLFCALPGERVDGHAFVERAFAAGAIGALVSRDPGLGLAAGQALLQVPDTLAGLAALARYHRDRYPVRVVAVTGSVGKTTTKDLIASALGSSLTVLANRGNLNTDIGLPLTIFGLGLEHQVACLEMGMRGPGEITRLAALARPWAGVITNVGPVHIELLGSIEAIARAKEELLWALPRDGAAVLNGDDARVAAMADRHRSRLATVLTYGLESPADVRATGIATTAAGETRFTVRLGGRAASAAGLAPGDEAGSFTVPLAGRHVVLDALAAVAAGLLFGVGLENIRRGLARPHLSAMRQQVIEAGGVRVVNDAYNAGPASMGASVDLLASMRATRGGRAIAVLGDMLELGDLSDQAHRDLGRAVAGAGIDYLVAVGPRAKLLAEEATQAGLGPDRAFHLDSNAAAAGKVLELVRVGDTVLVKASRGMKFEEIVERVVAGLDNGGSRQP